MKKFIVVFFCLLLGVSVRAQISDSLYKALPDKLKPADRNKLSLNEISSILSNSTSALGPGRMKAELDPLATRLDRESRKLPVKDMIPLRMIVANYRQGWGQNADSALRYIEELRALVLKEGDENRAVELYTLAAGVYTIQLHQYENAITMLTEALDISLKNQVPAQTSILYSQLTALYLAMFMFDEALASNEQFLKYGREGGAGDLVKGLYYILKIQILQIKYDEGCKLCQDNADKVLTRAFTELKPQAATWYNFLFFSKAISHFNLKQYPQVLASLDSSDKPEYRTEMTAPPLSAKQLYRGRSYIEMGRKAEGLALLEKNMEHSEDVDLSEDIAQLLYEAAVEKKDYRQALRWHEQWMKYRDSAHSLSQRGQIFEISQRYATVKKDAEIKSLELVMVQKQNQLNKALLVATAAAALLIISLLILYNRNRRHRQAQERAAFALIVEKQKKDEELFQHDIQAQLRQKEAILLQRRKISQDMHDQVSGQLAALRYFIASIRNSSRDKEIIKLIGEVEEASGEVYETARRFMHQLYENKEEMEADLMDFLLGMTRQFAGDHGLKVNLQTENSLSVLLNNEQQSQLTRILWEAMANIVKHAGATTVDIDISVRDRTCRFSIVDNGKGFDTSSASSGLGLRSMQQRIEGLGGNLSVKSGQQGTEIYGEFPLA